MSNKITHFIEITRQFQVNIYKNLNCYYNELNICYESVLLGLNSLLNMLEFSFVKYPSELP